MKNPGFQWEGPDEYNMILNVFTILSITREGESMDKCLKNDSIVSVSLKVTSIEYTSIKDVLLNAQPREALLKYVSLEDAGQKDTSLEDAG